MLTILLTILKIIGIIVLSILGFLILLILAILFVPLRYQIEGSFHDQITLKCKIHWLLHILSMNAYYEKEEANAKVNVLGIPIWIMKKASDQAEQSKKRKRKDRKRTNKNAEHTIHRKSEVKTISRQSSNLPNTIDEDFHSEQTEQNISINPKAKEIRQNKIEKNTSAINNTEKKVEINKDEMQFDSLNDKDKKDRKHIPFIQKIKTFLYKTLKIIKKIANMFLNMKYTFQRFYDKIKKAVQNIEYYKTVIQAEETKRAFETCKKCLSRIIKNIKPRKIQIHVDFGMEDPASTGDILCIYSMFFPWIGQYISINPDFENVIFAGDFYFKGYITLFHFACAVWIYIFDKDINMLKDALRRRNSND